MPENKRDSFTNPTQLRITLSSRPPAPDDQKLTSHGLAVLREKSVLRAEKINAPAIHKMRETCARIDSILADIQVNPEARRAVSIVTTKEIYIGHVVEMVKTLSRLISQIGFILNIFKAPYATVSANGLPEHNQPNTDKLRANLNIAIKQLQLLSIDPKRAKEELSALAPDNELLTKLDRMNKNRGSFEVRRAAEIVGIMKTLEEYLFSVIQAVKLGVAFNVETTRTELEQYEEIAGLNAIQAKEDEIFGLTDDAEMEKHWHDLFYEIEFTLANFSVKIMEIYRPMGIWTLEKIEVRALQNFTRQIEQKVEYLERKVSETVAQANTEPGIMERIRDSVIPGQRVSIRPSITDIQTGRTELAEAKKMLDSLRKILRIRIDLEKRKSK